MIVIIDYGMGNVGSIKNMLKKIGGTDVKVSGEPADILEANGVILPGVGSFDTGMRMLREQGFVEVLDDFVQIQKKPILGICLGMQLLGNKSEEGKERIAGLGYIDFETKRLSIENLDLKIPHMGWDYIIIKKETNILRDVEEHLRYYFVHSYYAVCRENKDVWMTCNYGMEITAAVQRNNIYGVQFHPEKSHKYGMELLKGFMEECL